jgi:hypothetical protein
MVRFLNNVLTIFMAGVLVLGLGGRLWMFLTTLVLTGNAGFSIRGSLEFILISGIVGLVAGSGYLWLIKGRIKRPLFEGTYFGLGTFVVLSFFPIGGRLALGAYDLLTWFPIMLGYSVLFWLYGIATVYGISKNFAFLNFSKR